jgi:peptidoglycan/xylan/chitin deacetylase (PgdA/CDA1 family)
VISISPQDFKAQMRYLKCAGYETISLNEYLNCVVGSSKSSSKRVVITFDDGFGNNYTEAFPILKRYGFIATLFISTGHVGKKSSWERDGSIPELPMLTWDEIGEMSDYGIRFESHACGHCYLSKLSEDEARYELIKSKTTIESKTGRKVEFFCHPYGDWSPNTKRLAKECGYVGAFTRPGFGSMSSKEDLYDLKRIGTAQFSCLEDFKAGLLGTYDWYVNLKAYLGIRRFRDLGIGRLKTLQQAAGNLRP